MLSGTWDILWVSLDTTFFLIRSSDSTLTADVMGSICLTQLVQVVHPFLTIYIIQQVTFGQRDLYFRFLQAELSKRAYLHPVQVLEYGRRKIKPKCVLVLIRSTAVYWLSALSQALASSCQQTSVFYFSVLNCCVGSLPRSIWKSFLLLCAYLLTSLNSFS